MSFTDPDSRRAFDAILEAQRKIKAIKAEENVKVVLAHLLTASKHPHFEPMADRLDTHGPPGDHNFYTMLHNTLIPTVFKLWPKTKEVSQWHTYPPPGHSVDARGRPLGTLLIGVFLNEPDGGPFILFAFEEHDQVNVGAYSDKGPPPVPLHDGLDMELNPRIPTDITGWLYLVKTHMPDPGPAPKRGNPFFD